jgi:GMP synthase-like glutamine amidotransferase
MFKSMGWTVVDHMVDADLVQLTGGDDVSPLLYRETLHPATKPNGRRDIVDKRLTTLAIHQGIPVAGICRGAQFLNVYNGGRLVQHVDGHDINGTHTVFDHYFKDEWQATSTHHQMMLPGEGGMLLATAKESSRTETMHPVGSEGRPANILLYEKGSRPDPEVIFYPSTNTLCFQPHPEFPGHKTMKERYFRLINELLMNGGVKCAD